MGRSGERSPNTVGRPGAKGATAVGTDGTKTPRGITGAGEETSQHQVRRQGSTAGRVHQTARTVGERAEEKSEKRAEEKGGGRNAEEIEEGPRQRAAATLSRCD